MMNFKKPWKILLVCLLAVSFLCACTQESESTPGGSVYQFQVEVTDGQGETEIFSFESEEDNLGQALEKAGFITGTEGKWGLYVESVNGMEAEDGAWWKVQIDHTDASTGVDGIQLEDGAIYSFILMQ